MSRVLNEEIQSIDKIAPGIFKITFISEYVAQNARPGQFINVKCAEGLNALLRRPISICSVVRDKSTFDIVFQIKGIGTEYLSQRNTGDRVDIIAPLGKPFDISEGYKKIAVVGGGIGIFPLLYLLQQSGQAERKAAFLGFRSKGFIVLRDKFGKASDTLNISTDDGSEGHKGLVTGLLEKDLEANRYDVIYTCGPTPMIKGVVEIAKRNNIKCQVSLEQRMGCGIGACLVCACKTKHGDDWQYSHVCKDGPVFWADEVVLD